jgi:hypothetical protein
MSITHKFPAEVPESFAVLEGGIGGHIHCILAGIKGDFLQVFFANALGLQADGNIQPAIEFYATLRFPIMHLPV